MERAGQDLRATIGHGSGHRIALDSACGPGAGGFLHAPVGAEPVLDDASFEVNARLRLFAPVCAMGKTCCHRKADGTLCGEALDSTPMASLP